jgi:hypothetical protein
MYDCSLMRQHCCEECSVYLNKSGDPYVSLQASSALLDLCGCCGSYMLPSVNQLLQLYSRLLGKLAGSQGSASSTC